MISFGAFVFMVFEFKKCIAAFTTPKSPEGDFYIFQGYLTLNPPAKAKPSLFYRMDQTDRNSKLLDLLLFKTFRFSTV